MKKSKKMRIILIMIMIIIFFMSVSYGFGVEDLNGKQEGLGKLKEAGGSMISIITSIGVVVSVIILAVIGLKYMLGSVAEKAEYKKTLMPYFIGAILVFGASTIAEIIYQFVN